MSTPISPDHALGRPPADPGDDVQPVPSLRERGDHPVDVGVELGDRGLQLLEVGHGQADQQRVVGHQTGPAAPGAAGGAWRATCLWPVRGSTPESRSPATSASSIARPEALLDHLGAGATHQLDQRGGMRHGPVQADAAEPPPPDRVADFSTQALVAQPVAVFQVQQSQQGVDRHRRTPQPAVEQRPPGAMKRSSSRYASTRTTSAGSRLASSLAYSRFRSSAAPSTAPSTGASS